MILVTGCSGVLGQALLAELRLHHENVVGLRRTDLLLEDEQATLDYFRAHRPRLVFHAAARVHGIMGNHDFPCDVYTQNIRVNTNVVEAARQWGCEKITAISTVAAYPHGTEMPIKEAYFWNGAPHYSERAYAQSKRAMLAHLEACKAQYGLDFTYPIVTNLFGPHDRFDETHGHVVPSLVSKFYRAAETGSQVQVWGTGAARRDFMFAADAAAAIVLASRAKSGALNIATGHTVAIREVVEALADIAGVTDVVWDSTKPDGQMDRTYDVSHLIELGFQPKLSLKDALRATYDWYAANYPDVRR
jgi:GDP-L-fucose synthase